MKLKSLSRKQEIDMVLDSDNLLRGEYIFVYVCVWYVYINNI